MKNLIQIYLYIQIFSEDKDKDKDKMGSSRVLHSLLCLVRLVFTLYHTHEQISEYIHTSKFDTNKCLNIFKKEKLIQIFVTNIFEYSNIWIYSSHSGCIIVWSAWFGLLMKELNIRSCLQFNIGDREVVAEKFSQGISGENPYWEDNQAVPSLSDHCIKTIVRWVDKPLTLLRISGKYFLRVIHLPEKSYSSEKDPRKVFWGVSPSSRVWAGGSQGTTASVSWLCSASAKTSGSDTFRKIICARSLHTFQC